MNFIACCTLALAALSPSEELPSSADVKAAFNAEKGKVRVVMIVSPVCPACVSGADVITQEVVKKVKDPRFAAFSVYIPMVFGDGAEPAKTAAAKLKDTGIKAFWDGKRELGTQFAEVVALPAKRTVAWDVYFVYGPDAVWGDKPPVPSFWMHQLADDEKCLDAGKFLAAVQTEVNHLPKLESVVTCPHCKKTQKETMPSDRCILTLTCKHCKAEIRAKKGTCCVFCSYGTEKCPDMQGK